MSRKTRIFIKNIEAKLPSISVIFLVICAMASGLFYMLPNQDTIVHASFNTDDWPKYKVVTVSNKLDDYATFINVTYDSDMNANFSDIRFVYNNVTELPYWLENKTDSTWAWFWVNNTGNYSSFEMFYGNSTASSDNNPYATFHFFSDVTNETDWTDDLGGGSSTTSGKYVVLEGTTNQDKYSLPLSAPGPIWDLQIKYKTENEGATDQMYFMASNGTAGDGSDVYTWAYSPHRSLTQTIGGYFYNDGSLQREEAFSTYTEGQEYIHRQSVDEGDDANGVDYYWIYVNNRSIIQSNTSIQLCQGDLDSLKSLMSGDWHADADTNCYIEYVFLRTFTTGTEPSFSLSAEHTAGGGGGEQCYYTFTGLDGSDRVTFGSGTPESILWSNATGNWDAGAMLIINISTNDTVNVTDICINLNDTDLGGNIHWENVSIDVAYSTTNAATANATFPNDPYSFGVDEGDYNISLNTSWDSDWGGANPFPLGNDSVGLDHVICIRFMVALPSDASTGGPYTIDTWELLWVTDE